MKYSVCIEWELACFTLIKRLLCRVHKNYLLSVMLFFLHNFCNLKQNLGLGLGFCLFTLIKRLNQCLARGISLIWNELENYGFFLFFFLFFLRILENCQSSYYYFLVVIIF